MVKEDILKELEAATFISSKCVTLERHGKVVNMLKAGNDISFKKKRRFSQVAGHNDTTVDRVLNRQAL